jgi:hypothetical protein
MKDSSGTCTLEIGSVTQAMKAQELLSRYAIPSKIIKTDSSSRRGCVYALSYACSQSNNVNTILSNAGLAPRSNREK